MTLPAWADPLLDAERMRATDRWAIEERGVPALELMERAGEGLAQVVERHAGCGPVAVVCGKGNNGGDGLVAARLLRSRGWEVDVLLLSPAEELSPDARAMHERLGGEPALPYEAGRLGRARVIVDALLGTGFSGAPRDPVRRAIAEMNAAEAVVVAADVPSGVNGSTGEVEGEAVVASATATFHRAKPGLWIHPGKAHAGAVEVVDIGIPPGAPHDASTGLITPAIMDAYPRRGPESTKFDSGVVVVLGGSRGMSGAPCMAALGAMRAGAGYVTVGAPATLEVALTARLPVESMLVALPDADGALGAAALDAAVAATGRAGAVVLGPGLSRRDEALQLARGAVERIERPLVLDADGLNALAGRLADRLAKRRWPTVLTPHAGELARLLEVESDAVKRRRLEHARAAASAAEAIVVLKGDDTLVVAPDGQAAVSPGGSPGLATAGTGDVLSGVIAALLARGLPAFEAACAGVHLHARAGRIAAERVGADAVIASDVIGALPDALADG